MRKLLIFGLMMSGAMAFGSVVENDVVIETSGFVLKLGEDATAKSLVLKSTGEELLDAEAAEPAFSVTQDRPFNNEIKLTFPNRETTFAANRVRREGEYLIVGFEQIDYSAKIRVQEADGYVTFELADFILGPSRTSGLKMTYPPVRSLKFINLPIKNRKNFGEWLNVEWDDDAAVAVVAAEPYTWIDGFARKGYRLLSAEARLGLKLRGAKAALVLGRGENDFMDAMDKMERGQGLPLGVASRRSDIMNRSIYWCSTVTPENVDKHIELAKRGGFKLMLLYYTCTCKGAKGDMGYGGIGDYELRKEYANGYDSLREMINKIKAEGIIPGLHVLQTFIGYKTHYVTPVADPRLNLKRHFTAAKTLDEKGGDFYVLEDPSDCPTNVESRVLAFNGELMTYEGYSTERPYRFTGVKRGYLDTRLVPHECGQIGGVLDVCEYGAGSCYINQDTDLQDEIADKIAKIYDCGFEFMYCDGSEGASVPYGIHVPLAQYRVWRKLAKKPLFMEGAAKAHFGWHHLSGANAFDRFPPEIFKKMIVRWPQYEAPLMRKDFSRLNFGWWGVYYPGQEIKGEKTIGTQSDMWEFGTSRAAAWDCPATIQFNLEYVKHTPRQKDLMEVMRRWEDVRAKNWLTPEQKERLKSSTQEHHLYVNDRGEYELVDIEMLPTPANMPELRGFVFERNGKRMVAYWHTNGSGKASVALGENGANVTLEAEDMRYFETALDKKGVFKAFAEAKTEGE